MPIISIAPTHAYNSVSRTKIDNNIPRINAKTTVSMSSFLLLLLLLVPFYDHFPGEYESAVSLGPPTPAVP